MREVSKDPWNGLAGALPHQSTKLALTSPCLVRGVIGCPGEGALAEGSRINPEPAGELVANMLPDLMCLGVSLDFGMVS